MHNNGGGLNKTSASYKRLLFLFVTFMIICLLFILRLFFLQVLNTEEYDDLSHLNNYKTAVLSAERGEIYDRNGEKFISNVISFNVEINRTTLENGSSFEILSELIELLSTYGVTIPDNCPITENKPYMIDSDYIFDNEKVRSYQKFLRMNELEESYFFDRDLYDFLTNKYGIPEEHVNSPLGRKITGIRYDMEVGDFSVYTPHVLLEDIDENLAVVIAENKHRLHGIEITKSYTRKYNLDSVLCHVLGRVGPIYKEEAEEYINQKGYSYDAIIGKEGSEKYFEDYLRGIDGTVRYGIDANNNIVGYEVTKEPKPGLSVMLTIDSRLQKIVEDALQEQIKIANNTAYQYGGFHAGEDSKAGAAVVVDVNSGEVLTLASCPGFDLNTFTSKYNAISTDPKKPLLNRATQGIYPPGSTFKMLTAAAALDTGTIDANTHILDQGEYKKYAPTYTPRCWVFLRNGSTHGYVNVKDALKYSCNYFFYVVSDKMGVDTIVEYAKDFGLGVKTGIEVNESQGILASPEYKESNGYVWNPGDTLQMSIGQSDNAFTPIQLAMYMSAIVNGGNRYKATIFKSANEFYTNKEIVKSEPEILNKTTLSAETVDIIKSAMRSVVDEQGGTAQGVFLGKDYVKDIGGKTGTAQVSGGSDTVLFVGFAPFDKPEIAVAIVIENGYKSARAAQVAAEIFDYYFENMKK